jgi:hypothetical protein
LTYGQSGDFALVGSSIFVTTVGVPTPADGEWLSRVPTDALGTATPFAEYGISPFACGSDVCWINQSPSGVGTSTLLRASPTGGSPTTVATVDTLQPATPTAFVFDGTDFFEMDSFAADGSTPARITKIPGNGGAKVTVVTLEDRGSAIAVDADCVYWANGGGVFSVAKTASATGG